jgi:hypothetical protein
LTESEGYPRGGRTENKQKNGGEVTCVLQERRTKRKGIERKERVSIYMRSASSWDVTEIRKEL